MNRHAVRSTNPPGKPHWPDSGAAQPARGSMSRARLRGAAALQTATLVLGGTILYLVFGHRTAGVVVWALALLGLILALVYPPAHEPLYRFARWLGRAVGWLLTLALLAPVYFLVFTPVGLWSRLTRKDPLRLRWPGEAASYWVVRRRPPTSASYSRQYLLEERR